MLLILDFLIFPRSRTQENCSGKLDDVLEVLAGLQEELSEAQQGFLKMQVCI